MARNIHLLPFEGTDFIDPPVSDSRKEEIHASVDWETEFPVCLHADYDSKSPAGNVFCAVGRDVVGVSTPIFPPLVFCYSDFIPFFRFLPALVLSLSLFFFSFFLLQFLLLLFVLPRFSVDERKKEKEKRKASTRMLSATTQRGLSGRFFARKIMAAIWTCDDEIV